MLSYTETIFTESKTLTEEQYLYIKDRTKADPTYSIINYKINFYKKFKGNIWLIIISLSVCIICFAIGNSMRNKSNTLETIEMISGVCFIIPLLVFIRSGSSYASAMEKRNDYFSWMHFCIFSSSNITEYYMFFYENQSPEANRELRKRYNYWRKGK